VQCAAVDCTGLKPATTTLCAAIRLLLWPTGPVKCISLESHLRLELLQLDSCLLIAQQQ
jgi:hypothetical protein